MECDICARYSSGNSAFHCPACARGALYPYRIDHARLLLEKEQLRREVEATIPTDGNTQGNSTSPTVEDIKPGTKKLQHEINQVDLQRSKERIEEIARKSESLKERIENYKREMENRKAAVTQRRQENEAALSESAETRPGVYEQLRKTARRRVHRYDSLYKDIVSARIFLCKEAAELAGLRRHERKAPDSSTLESYTLNGLQVIDLRDLNNTPPQRITASLTSISRLLVQACYYLEIRLPAEITLPGEDYPLPTIFSPSSSFLPQNKDVTFPGITSSTSSSPAASRTIDPQDQSPQSKPRPLYLDRKLPVLMREDPSQYTHFIEGVSLLAWTVAWLCRTQGLPIANTDWEEICAVGRNLWLLLIDAPTAAQQHQQQQRKDGRAKQARKATSDTSGQSAASASASQTDAAKPPRPIAFGTLSHGTAHTLLLHASSSSIPTPTPLASSPSSPSSSTAPSTPAPSPTTNIDISPRAWKFASPTSVRDSLKKYLANEMSAQEWEVLSSGEFEGWVHGAGGPGASGAVDEEPVVVGASKARLVPSDALVDAGKGGDEAGDGAAAKAGTGTGVDGVAVRDGEDGGDESGGRGDERPKGSSGWMKLKSRSTY